MPELSDRVKQDVEEAMVRSESRFALRKIAGLLTFAFLAFKIIKKSGRAEAMSDDKDNPVRPPDA